MKKNLLYIGLILIAAGIVVGLVGPGTIIPSLFPSPSLQSATVAPNSISYLPLQLNESGLPILAFNSSSGIDFYFANGSAYAAINGSRETNSSARGTAVGLEGKGVYAIYENSTEGAFPFLGYANVTAPAYLLNTTLLQPGTYYIVLYNRGNATAIVAIKSLSVSIAKVQSGEASVGTYVVVAAAVFLAGMGLAIYAFVSKDKGKEQAAIDADAAKEYERIGGRGGRKGSKK